MRDFLEDIGKHDGDGYSRVQKAMKAELPKRFYKASGIGVVADGFAVTLDGRTTKTPGRKIPVVVESAVLATRMAEEWGAQGEHIDPQIMPMVRLVNSALEGGEESMPAFRDEVVKYAGNDLLLYRADSPRELVALQDQFWDGMLVRVARHFGVAFQPTIGIIHQPQPPATLSKLAAALEGVALLPLTALVSITGITGSGVMAVALLSKLATPDEVWTTAHVDEDYQASQWGVVEEATERSEKRRREFDAAVAVLEAMQTA